jgi:hypothetical protein
MMLLTRASSLLYGYVVFGINSCLAIPQGEQLQACGDAFYLASKVWIFVAED